VDTRIILVVALATCDSYASKRLISIRVLMPENKPGLYAVETVVSASPSCRLPTRIS